jgi:predicted nucleic acid-binding protein
VAERVLVDTSAWIDALRQVGNPEVRATVRTLTVEGRAVLCDMVLLELWNGAQGPRDQKVLRDLERELPRVPTPPEVWATATDLSQTCRKAGLSVPVADLLIAACAEHHKLRVLHLDAHFDRIAQLRKVNGKP